MTSLPVHVSLHPTFPLRNRTIAYGSTKLGLESFPRLFKTCRMCFATRFRGISIDLHHMHIFPGKLWLRF